MFCPSCGLEATRGLNYCNRCGTSLSVPDDRLVRTSAYPKVGAMFWGVTLLSAVMIIAMFTSIANNPVNTLPPAYLTAVVIASSAASFGIVVMLIKLLLRLTGLSTGPSPGRRQEVLPQVPMQQLNAPQSFASVTENTTRNFPKPESISQQR